MHVPVARRLRSRALQWLRGTPADRTRFADMSRRISRARIHGALMGGVNAAAAWWYGPRQLVVVAVALTALGTVIPLGRRARNQELVAAAVFALLEACTAAAVMLSDGARGPLLPLLAVPVFSQAVCFRPAVFLSGMGLSGVLGVAASVLAPATSANGGPAFFHLVAFLAVLACLAAAALTLATSDLTSRDEAVFDPMTGLFNRLSLSARFTDAQDEARAGGGSVGLVMCDVDHFKRINDEHGHERGDQVLQQLAERLRATLRETDLAFRVGGEEFVLLLPGQDLAGAAGVAERVRAAIAAAPVAGLTVTVSAGVVSATGSDSTLSELLRNADAALYTAKRGGRDRVVSRAAEPVPTGPAAARLPVGS